MRKGVHASVTDDPDETSAPPLSEGGSGENVDGRENRLQGVSGWRQPEAVPSTGVTHPSDK